MFLKLTIKVVAFFLGHPVYSYHAVESITSTQKPQNLSKKQEISHTSSDQSLILRFLRGNH